jgi:hypothetical protein
MNKGPDTWGRQAPSRQFISERRLLGLAWMDADTHRLIKITTGQRQKNQCAKEFKKESRKDANKCTRY